VRVTFGQSEAEWVARARAGDGEAFARLVETFQVPVYNLCSRMLGDAGEAEDAAQETFLRAFRNLKRYDPQRPFPTWLLSIASHYCIDMIRRRRFLPAPGEDVPREQEPADSGTGPEEALAIRERSDRISKLTRGLGPQERAAITLHYWYDLSYEEIAEVLSTSVGAVKSRMHRARRTLAERWREGEPQPALVRGRHNEPSAV